MGRFSAWFRRRHHDRVPAEVAYGHRGTFTCSEVGLPDGFVPFAPDIAVEVLSPSDAHLDVEEKIEEWLQAGTALVWVINPRGRTLTVHRTGRDPRDDEQVHRDRAV